jgi:hypothetical protein
MVAALAAGGTDAGGTDCCDRAKAELNQLLGTLVQRVLER